MEGVGHSGDGDPWCAASPCRISFPSRWSRVGRHGRSGAWCSASICRAAPKSSSRSISTTCASSAWIRCATTCAGRSATARINLVDAADRARRQRRGQAARGGRLRGRARQASRPVAAARRRAAGQRPAHPRGHRRRRRTDPADADGGGGERAHPPDDRAIDPDRREAHQRTRPRRADDPAPGRRPHPGAGAGPRRSAASHRTAGADRQARVPHGRQFRQSPGGAAGPRAAGFRGPVRESGRPAGSDPRLQAGAGGRRRPDRCPGGLRPAHQRADRVVPLQHQRRAQVRDRDPGECRASASPSCSTTR